jgi:regulation of enolase protein 1 (concanavalin A-like superfamily)
MLMNIRIIKIEGIYSMNKIIISSVILLFIFTAQSASAITSDDFNSPTLNSMWTIVNPRGGDATITTVGSGTPDALLSITVPAGTNHDIWIPNDAPRVMQSVSNTDFEIDVKFQSQVSQKYQMQGIIIEQDPGNYLRFDFYSDGSNTRIYAANFSGGSVVVNMDTIITPGNPIYMRVNRTGNQWTQSYSYNGVSWTPAASFSRVLTVTEVGPFAGNYGYPENTAPGFTGLIDYFFNTASPVVPEDTPGADTTHPTVTGNAPTGAAQVNAQITIAFSEAMNQTSVQSAFSTSPGTSGSFTWSGNTMTYTPSANLIYNNIYTVTVGTGARDLAGNGLQTQFSWQFNTGLTNEFLVFQGDRLFNDSDHGFHYFYRIDRDTIPSSWPSNWISPVDYWNGSWYMRVQLKTRNGTESNAFTLQPCIWQYPADGNTTIPAELESCGSQFMLSNLDTYVNINGPLANWWHKGVNGDKKIDLSRPYDIKRMGLVLRQFSPNCLISDYVTPNCWDQRGNYTPFSFNLTIVAVANGATFSGWSKYIGGGDATPPNVIGNTPTGANIPVYTQIKITFSEAMNHSSVQSAFSTNPVTTGSFSWSGNNMTYTPGSNLAYNTIYNVIVGTGARDLAGINMLSSYNWQFTTAQNLPSINLINNPGFELGTTSWVFHTNGTGTFTAASPGYGGTALAANLALDSGGTNIQLYQTGITLEPGTRYRLSFAAYSNTGHDLTVYLHKHLTPYTNYGLSYTAALSSTWQTFTTEFITTGFSGTVTDGRLRFWFASFAAAGDVYHIDDVRLEKVG